MLGNSFTGRGSMIHTGSNVGTLTVMQGRVLKTSTLGKSKKLHEIRFYPKKNHLDSSFLLLKLNSKKNYLAGRERERLFCFVTYKYTVWEIQ